MINLPGSSPYQDPRRPLARVDWEILASDAGYRLEAISRKCGYSIRTLQRYISHRFHVSLHDFIAEIRLRKASALLEAGCAVKEAALELGYKQTSHFIRCYRQKYGMTPGAWMARSIGLETSPKLLRPEPRSESSQQAA
jgi:AraC-like DNA-binding protein